MFEQGKKVAIIGGGIAVSLPCNCSAMMSVELLANRQ